MEIAFVTTNRHKFQEVQGILRPYPLDLVHLNREYPENHDASMDDIAREAMNLSRELQRPLVLEDTGLSFEAYPAFPGALPKFVFTTLGYKGILKLLEGESRNAHFRTVAAYCAPGEDPVLFDGTMRGRIAEEVHNEDIDVMPYDRLFIPEGKSVTISDMRLEEKNTFSQRAQAFRKFGEYVAGLGSR